MGWPTGREPSGHGASVVVGARDNRLQGTESPMAQGSRLPCTGGGVCPGKAGVCSRRETSQGKSQSPVARSAGGRDTNLLKPLNRLV